MQFSKFFTAIIIGFGILLTACVFPEKEDPFVRLPEEELKTLDGEIFPFSVSVATSATHRLEKDGKLVSYLASDVVRLEDFEGQKVEVDGVARNEKMREIFWVEAVRLKDKKEEVEEEKTEERFLTKKFTFIYPKNWEYSLSPDGTAYFLDKEDPGRRVFLTFSVSEIEKEDKKTDPNVLISNLAGTKEVSTDEFGRERQELTLFSNLYDQKYSFIFTNSYEEFEKKKAFFKLLNSFVEGEENVRNAKKEDMRAQAKKEAEKIEEETGETGNGEEGTGKFQIPNDKLQTGKENSSGESKKSEGVEESSAVKKETGDKETESLLSKFWEEKAEEADVSDKTEEVTSNKEFKNLIDARSFNYDSGYYKFSMKVPYGFWFRNFGPSEEALTRIGFATYEFSTPGGSEYWVQIKESENSTQKTVERMDGDTLIIEHPRDFKSYFEASGPTKFRDAMMSILSSIQTQ